MMSRESGPENEPCCVGQQLKAPPCPCYEPDNPMITAPTTGLVPN